jgi:hypothetical protein
LFGRCEQPAASVLTGTQIIGNDIADDFKGLENHICAQVDLAVVMRPGKGGHADDDQQEIFKLLIS